jgi:hypothetical protein
MSKKSETHLDNVMMLTLGSTILLMGVETRDLMRDANITKKGIKFLVFPTRLDSNNLAIKPSLNKALKLKKIFKHLRFGTEQINLGEFAIIIYEANLVFLATKGINSRTPHIRKDKFQWNR